MLSRFDDAAQDRSAFRERKLGEAPPLVNQDVEGVINNARFCGAKILQKIEVGPAVGAKGYQFSVDDCVIREIFQGLRDVVEPSG